MSALYFLQKMTPHATMMCKMALLLGWQTSVQPAYRCIKTRAFAAQLGLQF